jgi:hypothetical protein
MFGAPGSNRLNALFAFLKPLHFRIAAGFDKAVSGPSPAGHVIIFSV